MITHIVLFKLNDDSAEARQPMIDALAGLADAVPTVRSLQVGANVVPQARAFHVGLVVTFDDREGLDTYSAHPAHVGFVKEYRSLWADVASVDFES